VCGAPTVWAHTVASNPALLLIMHTWVMRMQALDARQVMMAAMAKQWFGTFMRPRAASDEWLVIGLAGWLEGQIVKGFQGRTEILYRFGLVLLHPFMALASPIVALPQFRRF
jgi:hypothetical protein